MPLTATIGPSRSAAAAAATASPPATSAPPGPSSQRARPHCRACVRLAWKRRSRGSSYSARQRAHISKPAIVVSAPVVGDAAHDREPRAAVGAVDERIAVAAVRRVEQLGQAVRAGRGVGRDQRLGLARAGAGSDLEAGLAPRPSSFGRDALDRGQRRRLGGQALEEARDRLRRPLHLEQDAALVVEDEAAEAQLGGEPVDVGPEPDPLHRALDARRDPAPPSGRRRSTGLRRRPRQLDQLAQRVVGARLRLLDAGDVLRAGDDHVVGEILGGDPAPS